MIHRICASLTILALLTACGGGGGAAPSNALLPKTPATAAAATFAFKIPGKATSARVRRPYYVSQATAGVAIDWNSTDPTHPDYASSVSAVCPGTLPSGVTACSIDAQGNTDYTFQLQILPGSYTFTVSTFDAPPSGGAFTGHMLAQGQLAAPVTIVAGQANNITGLTFYGVPTSVSFISAQSQAHTIPFNGGFGVIGNAPATFYAQGVDADGYAIGSTDPGAPAITISESATDSPQYFAAATTTNPYAFTLRALAPSDLSTAAIIDVSAVPPAATGLASAQKSFLVTAIPELWLSQATNPIVAPGTVYGYAMIGSPIAVTNGQSPIDWTPTSGYGADVLAVDKKGNVWVSDGAGTIHEFGAAVGSAGLLTTTNTITQDFGHNALQQVVALAVDANNVLWVADQTAGGSGNGEIIAYNISNPAAPTALSSITGTAHASLANPTTMAIVPTSSTIPPGLWGLVLTISSFGKLDILTPSAGATSITDTFDSVPIPSAPSPVSLAMATNGTVWYYDGKAGVMYAASLSATPTLTVEASYSYGMGISAQAAADPAGNAWFASTDDGPYFFTLGGCPGSCAVAYGYELYNIPNETNNYGAYIAP